MRLTPLPSPLSACSAIIYAFLASAPDLPEVRFFSLSFLASAPPVPSIAAISPWDCHTLINCVNKLANLSSVFESTNLVNVSLALAKASLNFSWLLWDSKEVTDNPAKSSVNLSDWIPDSFSMS